MIPSNFSSYKVEIKNVRYKNENGTSFLKTAIITFIDPGRNMPVVEMMGFLELEDIFKLISNEKDIDLSECYILNFSLNTYRTENNLNNKEPVKFSGLTVQRAFFDSTTQHDFSYAEFTGEKTDFNSCVFVNGSTSFHGSKFLSKEVDFSNGRFLNGNVDFSQTFFYDSNVNMKNIIFGSGIKDFKFAEFGNGLINFANTEFNDGEVSFINTNFNQGDISFKFARFGKGKVDFRYARFGNGDVIFERTDFGNGDVDFKAVEFNHGIVNFNRSHFGLGEISFDGAQLKSGKFNFKVVHVDHGEVNFENLEFDDADLILDKTVFGSGTLSFYNSRVKILSLKSCHLDIYTDLRVAKCKKLELSDTIIRDIVDLQPFETPVDIEEIDLIGCRLIGRVFIDWELNRVKEMIDIQENSDYFIKAEQFRLLKQNFNNNGDYQFEDFAYIEFMRNREKAILKRGLANNPLGAIWHYPLYWFKRIAFDWAGLYATSPGRVLLSSVVVYVIFSLLVVVLPFITDAQILSGDVNPNFWKQVANAFYYSAITFFTIGYGEYLPTGIIRLVAGLLGFFGVFMMSYFAVAFARKILR